MDITLLGEIVADIIDVRFSYSGIVAFVSRHSSDYVKKGEIIASLDRKALQIDLDRQLADYEKVRADFDMFVKKVGETQDDVTKLQKTGKQADLNRSVKDVEIAKGKLDEADLFSPVNGAITDMGGIVPKLYVTPSSNPIRIIDESSIRFHAWVEQNQVRPLLSAQKASVSFPGIDRTINGLTVPVVNGKDGKFEVIIRLDDTSGLIPGLKGEAKIRV